jgi:hypothetical protein
LLFSSFLSMLFLFVSLSYSSFFLSLVGSWSQRLLYIEQQQKVISGSVYLEEKWQMTRQSLLN